VGIRRGLALLALPIATLAWAPTASATERSQPARVFVVVLENREYDQVVGSDHAPYLNALAARETVATRYHAVAHPSLPNYLALLGGSTFGIEENCTECAARGDNLALQLSRAGIPWRAYMGGTPRPCFRGAESGRYVKRHNPFMHFPSIADDPRRCRQVVPATRLDADLRRHALPAFGWLSPDLCKDGHDCDLRTTDRHLAHLIPRIIRKLGSAGTLILTFDEGTSTTHGGGHILTIVAHPGRQQPRRLTRPYDHYSLLGAIERHFGLPPLRNARTSPPLPL
jgi:hypothetical protein